MLNKLEFTKKAVKGMKLSKDDLLSLVESVKREDSSTRLEHYLWRIEYTQEMNNEV